MAMAASKTLFLSVFFLINAALLLPGLQGSRDLGVLGQNQREFDFFMLATQWPGTYCPGSEWCSTNACYGPNPLTEFTILGLWPDYDDGTWPSCCSNSEFNLTQIIRLVPELEKYWPSLSCSFPAPCHGVEGLVWAHEWEKHGTCSYPILNNEFSYFYKAIDLYFSFNITNILNSAGFLPSNDEKYVVEDIAAALKNAIGATPQLACQGDLLGQVRICLDKEFALRDCGTLSSALHSSSACPSQISLPPYSPLSLEHAKATKTWSANGGLFSVV